MTGLAHLPHEDRAIDVALHSLGRDFRETRAVALAAWARIDAAQGRLEVITRAEAEAIVHVINVRLSYEEAVRARQAVARG